MNARVLNHVTGRLSLRPPQAESLAKLRQALGTAPEMLGHGQDVPAILATLKAHFPTLDDFEREFPSLCFALATGVGKDAPDGRVRRLPASGARLLVLRRQYRPVAVMPLLRLCSPRSRRNGLRAW